MLDFSVRIGARTGYLLNSMDKCSFSDLENPCNRLAEVRLYGQLKSGKEILRFIRTKNNRAPDGEDRYAVRSTCFLAEDRNTIVLQGDGFIAAGRISAQCDMDAQVKELIQSRVAKI